jgi:hypothetical protein
MAKNVADLLLEVLVEAGVRRIYGVSGDSLNGTTDCVRTRSDIQWVHVRHERRRRSQRAPKPISLASWRFALEAVDPETFI